MARKILEEKTYVAGNGDKEIYVSWEDGETGQRGSYLKGSKSDPDFKET